MVNIAEMNYEEWKEASSKAWKAQEAEQKQMDKIREIVDQYNDGLLMPKEAITSILLLTPPLWFQVNTSLSPS